MIGKLVILIQNLKQNNAFSYLRIYLYQNIVYGKIKYAINKCEDS